jgi:hypothetical protein
MTDEPRHPLDEFIAQWGEAYTITFDGVMWHARRPHGPHLSAISAEKLRDMLFADWPKRDRSQGVLEPDPAKPTDQGSL